MESGSLTIDRPKKRYELDEKFWPLRYELEQRKDAHFVVEEFMLLANQFVAMEISSKAKEVAVLRCHDSPKEAKRNYMEGLLAEFGLKAEFSSSQALKESFDRIFNDNKIKKEYKQIIKFFMMKMLEAANYFVADTKS